jgi:protein-disulfide isomerase
MKSRVLAACAIAVLALGLAQESGAANRAPPAKARDWTQVVRPTPAGGFVMGNPNAKVKLVEFGSMTCPHCRAFDADGVPTLVGKYVKSGQVSWEFRNYVRDAFDITAALITRCDGPRTFFPLTRAVFQDQSNWIAKVQAAPQDQLKSLDDVPMNRRFMEMARLSGLQQLAQAHGLPTTRTAQCLSDEKSVNQLAEMDKRAMADFPDFAGTPTFVLNGKMLEKTANWEALEPQLKAALGQRG